MHPIDILLVEDNEGDILLTKEALLDHEMVNNIFVVKDGTEALNYLLKRDPYNNSPSPDLVLLDINLPKLNGHEVLKQIRSIDSLKQIPVVMLSTSSSSEDVLKSFNNEANCFITKPIDIDSFIREITSIENLKISSEHLLKS